MQATFYRIEEQNDYIFKIYDKLTGMDSKRIKVRTKKERECIVYVYSRDQNDENVDFDFYEVVDQSVLLSIFTSLYNEPIMIRKKREVWGLHNLLFHLDEVEGIGDIFEIEVINKASSENFELAEFLKLIENFLLSPIQGSNEDLIADS